MKPRLASAAERWRWLRLTQRNAASGSPRIDGSASSFKASKIPGCVSIAGFCPPPLRRTRSLHRPAPDRRSAKPRPMVLRAIPVVRETAAIPPRPAARASLAANRRRSLSLRNDLISKMIAQAFADARGGDLGVVSGRWDDDADGSQPRRFERCDPG